VNSYYPGVELLVVLRGAEPFSQFFVAAYHKRSQFDAFDERSGARVGTFSQDTEDESPGTKLCLENQAVSNRPPLLPTPSNELAFLWRAPSLTDRAYPGAPQLTGPLVIKATMARDPLTIAPNEEDPGMVQVSYTLAEVDPPKKGHLLTEISQKIDKEEKKYEADLVANHQVGMCVCVCVRVCAITTTPILLLLYVSPLKSSGILLPLGLFVDRIIQIGMYFSNSLSERPPHVSSLCLPAC